MASILAIRLIDSIWWRIHLVGKSYNGAHAINRFITGTSLTAIMWCIYALCIFSYVDTIELATTIISISALACGGAAVLAAHRNTAMFYAFILLCPFSAGLALAEEVYRQLLGIMGLAFCIVIVLVTRKTADFIRQAITLKNENAVLVRDMEARVESRTQKIYELSNLDPLTCLFNRTAFLQHFKKELDTCIEKNITMALLFIDLDGFKKVNDTLGHEVGDQLLTQTAKRLEEHCSDTHLLCRWGGDEFLIAIKDMQESDVVKHAMQIIGHISRVYVFEKNHLSISATVGVALYPDHADTANSLIQLADTAMHYQKKRTPSAASVFSEDLGRQLAREQKIRDGLAEAIEKQQLRLVFQPIVSSDNGEIHAFEALLRWRLEDEEIMPDEFISIAEQYGYICKIGAWVLEQACAIASQWGNEKAAVCVNVSVTQLQDENFIGIVDAALANSQLPAKFLHIEITESVFADDKDIVLKQIKALQSKGVKVSIDDFGTGYSSLSVMQDLAVNVVKIDRSFVENLDTNGSAIINAVINIAESLNYLVVAEGVETAQQAQRLAEMGVHFQQGFYYSTPIEQNQIDDFLPS